MSATSQTTAPTDPVDDRREPRRLSRLWYVRYGLIGVALGAAWASEQGHPWWIHVGRVSLVLAAALAMILWRWSRWMGRGALRPWTLLALTDAAVVLVACVSTPLAAPLPGRPELVVAAVVAVTVAAVNPLLHRRVGGPTEYSTPTTPAAARPRTR